MVHIISPTALPDHIWKAKGRCWCNPAWRRTGGHRWSCFPPDRTAQKEKTTCSKWQLHRKKWQISGTVCRPKIHSDMGQNDHNSSILSSCCQPNISMLFSLCTSELDAIQEHQTLVLFDTEIAQGTVLSAGAMRWSVVFGGATLFFDTRTDHPQPLPWRPPSHACNPHITLQPMSGIFWISILKSQICRSRHETA